MEYQPPFILFNEHLQTIYPALLRKIDLQDAETITITTPDDDFLELDLYRQNAPNCVVISHGLEGNSRRAYVLGMARAFYQQGYDVLAWNYRGCGSKMNKKLRFYHSGATDDLGTVIDYAAKHYTEITLVGFSLGGNLTLKYLGEPKVNEHVKKAVALSVPLDLHTSCLEISKRSNFLYARRFLKSLTKKVLAKAATHKELDVQGLDKINSLIEFDDRYTAPLHGFKDAVDYYQKCSSIHFLPRITVPTLLVNAKNDPFLSPQCYPETTPSSSLTIEYPESGGHVGFALFDKKGLYWSELRALDFVNHS
ncbi:MAG: alpha/beta fold hydrolase [Bacteroidetes bacterium]|nr:alpha/beta fold hydrolase [Bacteroidota bacterium]